MCIYFLFMKTVWILFNGGWSSKAKLKDACPITYWGENILTFARALINKILLYGVFFFSCPSVSRIPSIEKTRIENTGESCETMQGTSCLKGKERGGDGGGKGERERKKRKKKICGTKEKASHRVGRLWKMRCQEYCWIPTTKSGIYRYSLEFLWTNEAVIERPAATNRRHAAYRFRI